MIMFFPMSLSGTTQRWFASLDVSRRQTWDDLAQRVRGIETEARGVDHLIYLPLEGEDFIGY